MSVNEQSVVNQAPEGTLLNAVRQAKAAKSQVEPAPRTVAPQVAQAKKAISKARVQDSLVINSPYRADSPITSSDITELMKEVYRTSKELLEETLVTETGRLGWVRSKGITIGNNLSEDREHFWETMKQFRKWIPVVDGTPSGKVVIVGTLVIHFNEVPEGREQDEVHQWTAEYDVVSKLWTI